MAAHLTPAFVEFLLFWLICGIVAAVIGSKKGQGCGGFAAGVLLGPLGIVLMLFTRGDRKLCGFCREQMNRSATVCPHCHREERAAPTCAYCNASIHPDATVCPQCRREQPTSTNQQPPANS
jgi:predicted amidophosphoribosyltransferase